jgi:hypothetical protein
LHNLHISVSICSADTSQLQQLETTRKVTQTVVRPLRLNCFHQNVAKFHKQMADTTARNCKNGPNLVKQSKTNSQTMQIGAKQLTNVARFH